MRSGTASTLTPGSSIICPCAPGRFRSGRWRPLPCWRSCACASKAPPTESATTRRKSSRSIRAGLETFLSARAAAILSAASSRVRSSPYCLFRRQPFTRNHHQTCSGGQPPVGLFRLFLVRTPRLIAPVVARTATSDARLHPDDHDPRSPAAMVERIIFFFSGVARLVTGFAALICSTTRMSCASRSGKT